LQCSAVPIAMDCDQPLYWHILRFLTDSV